MLPCVVGQTSLTRPWTLPLPVSGRGRGAWRGIPIASATHGSPRPALDAGAGWRADVTRAGARARRFHSAYPGGRRGAARPLDRPPPHHTSALYPPSASPERGGLGAWGCGASPSGVLPRHPGVRRVNLRGAPAAPRGTAHQPPGCSPGARRSGAAPSPRLGVRAALSPPATGPVGAAGPGPRPGSPDRMSMTRLLPSLTPCPPAHPDPVRGP
jgi:hypothetical protein